MHERPERRVALVSVLALAALGAVAAAAQPSVWVPRGPGGGGALYTPTLSPHQSAEAFVSCDMGGLYRTTDFGASWALYDFRRIVAATQGCQVQFTSDPKILYAIDYAGEAPAPAKSLDGGKTWSHTAADPTSGSAYSVVADPGRTTRVLVTDYSRLYVSNDGGATFSTARYTDSAGLAIGGAFFDGNTIYLGTNAGLLVSPDGGGTFALSPATGIPATEAIVSFAGARQGSTLRFYAVTLGSGDVFPGVTGSDHALYRSVYTLDGGGGTWVARTTGIAAGDHPFFAGAPRADVSTAYLAGGSDAGVPTVYRTSDGGLHWSAVLLTTNNLNISTGWCGTGGNRNWGYPEYALGLAVSPSDPSRALVTDLGFAHVTSDGGATWHQAYVRPAYENAANTAVPASKAYLSAGLENTTCWGITWSGATHAFASFTDIRGVRTTDGGSTWSFDYTGHTQNTMYRCVRHPSTGVLYAATSTVHDLYQSTYLQDSRIDGGGGLVLYSADSGKTWQILHNFGHVVCWVALDPTNANRLYAAVAHSTAGGIYVSSDPQNGAASTWTKVAANPARTEGHPYTVTALNDGTLVATYSGRRNSSGAFTDSSGVFVSVNGGASWADRSAAGMHYWTKDLVVAPSDSAQNTWYVGVASGWGGAPNGLGGLYKSTDRGLNWSRILTLDRVESCTIAPSDPAEMYVATEGQGLWYTANLTATTPAFSAVTSYPFGHPLRVFYDPQAGRVWVTSFGYGMAEGFTGATGARAPEVSATAASPLLVSRNGALVDLSFESVTADHYNLYVSNSPKGHPFRVLSAASGREACVVRGLSGSGGRLSWDGVSLESGITGPTAALYFFVSAGNGAGREGPLSTDSLGEEVTPDAACDDALTW